MKVLIESYNTLKKRLSEIKKYIHETMTQHALIESLREKDGITLDEKQYLEYLKSLKSSTIQYNALIISIYGCFENYVDSIASQYCNILLQDGRVFETLPKKLKDKLRIKVGEFLTNPQRFPEDIDLQNTIHGYSLMLKSDFSRLLDLRFVTNHGGNLRSKEVVKLFSDIIEHENMISQIISSQSIKRFYTVDKLMEAHEYEQKSERAKQNIEKSELMKPLEDLVDQRNSVAHSWNEDSRVSIDYITNEIIPFLEALAHALLEVCFTSQFVLDEKAIVVPNGKPIALYKHNIVCLNNQSMSIAIGDYLIYGKGSHRSFARIVEMQHNHIAISEVNSSQSIDVALKIEGYFSSSDVVKYVIKI